MTFFLKHPQSYLLIKVLKVPEISFSSIGHVQIRRGTREDFFSFSAVAVFHELNSNVIHGCKRKWEIN